MAFAAPDVAPEAVPVQSYGSSIPLTKALSSEVLLAWQMNAEPLPRAHGGPVRVVVPGYIGARSVKWVTAITVQPVPSQNYFQALDYRLLPPDADPDTAAPGEGISLSSLPLNCDILVPGDDAEISAGPLTIRGWALAGDGRSVARVDVSLDDGRTWQQANLEPAISRWAWRQWSITVETQPGPLSVTARAWDDTGVTHPESPASLWNPRGYGNNAWAHITASARLGIRDPIDRFARAGEWLENRVGRSPLLHTHTELGDTMLYFSIALLVAAILLALLHVRASRSHGAAAGLPGQRVPAPGPAPRRASGHLLAALGSSARTC